MTNQENKGAWLEIRLAAYVAAVGATLAVSPTAEATIISFDGPWTGTGTNSTLLSFNLAGDVNTDGTAVPNEQLLFGQEQGTVPVFGTQNPSAELSQHALFVQARGNAAVGTNGGMPAFMPAVALGMVGEPVFVTPNGFAAYYPGGTGMTKNGNTTVIPPSTSVSPFNLASLAALGVFVTNNNPSDVLLGAQTSNAKKKGAINNTLNGKSAMFLGPGQGGGTGLPLGMQGYVPLFFDGPNDAVFPGWAEVQINAGDSVTMLSYAYDDSGAPIALGDEGSPQPSPPTVPEPDTLSLLAIGAAGLAVLRRRRRRSAEPETRTTA